MRIVQQEFAGPYRSPGEVTEKERLCFVRKCVKNKKESYDSSLIVFVKGHIAPNDDLWIGLYDLRRQVIFSEVSIEVYQRIFSLMIWILI